jgi:hypothetical protein
MSEELADEPGSRLGGKMPRNALRWCPDHDALLMAVCKTVQTMPAAAAIARSAVDKPRRWRASAASSVLCRCHGLR